MVPLIAMNMSHYFKEHAFFLDHPFLGEHLRATLKTSDDTRVNVTTEGGKVSITVEAALGSAGVYAWTNKNEAAPYPFSKYKPSTPPISHPIIDNLMELMPTRKRQRDLDLHNDRKLHEESLEKVMSELEKRSVRAKWIIGEFITVESRNTIRICLRKPFVYM